MFFFSSFLFFFYQCIKYAGISVAMDPTHRAHLKVSDGASVRSSSYSWWTPGRCSLPRWARRSSRLMASGPGMWTDDFSRGMPTSSSTGSTCPFWPARSCWFQPGASRGSSPPRCSGRQSLGRYWRRSDIFTIWTWRGIQARVLILESEGVWEAEKGIHLTISSQL